MANFCTIVVVTQIEPVINFTYCIDHNDKEAVQHVPNFQIKLLGYFFNSTNVENCLLHKRVTRLRSIFKLFCAIN